MVSSAVRTVVVLLIGCTLILLAVPVAQAFASRYVLSKGMQVLDKEDNASAALEEMDKLQNWTSMFPNIAVRMKVAQARCNYRLGDTAMALENAEESYTTPTTRPSPPLPTSLSAAKAFFIEAPRCLANKLIGVQLTKEQGAHDPMAGYYGVLYEAELTEHEGKMRASAHTVLAKKPEDRRAKALLAYLDTPERKRKMMVRVKTSGGFATKKRELSQKEVHDRKLRKLTAQRQDVLDRIQKYKGYMAGSKTVAPADQEAYDKANAEYQRAARDGKALTSRANSAEGAQRMALLDQLRRKKAEEMALRNKRDEAARKIGASNKIPKNDPQLRKLEAELQEVNNELDLM